MLEPTFKMNSKSKQLNHVNQLCLLVFFSNIKKSIKKKIMLIEKKLDTHLGGGAGGLPGWI